MVWMTILGISVRISTTSFNVDTKYGGSWAIAYGVPDHTMESRAVSPLKLTKIVWSSFPNANLSSAVKVTEQSWFLPVGNNSRSSKAPERINRNYGWHFWLHVGKAKMRLRGGSVFKNFKQTAEICKQIFQRLFILLLRLITWNYSNWREYLN